MVGGCLRGVSGGGLFGLFIDPVQNTMRLKSLSLFKNAKSKSPSLSLYHPSNNEIINSTWTAWQFTREPKSHEKTFEQTQYIGAIQVQSV